MLLAGVAVVVGLAVLYRLYPSLFGQGGEGSNPAERQSIDKISLGYPLTYQFSDSTTCILPRGTSVKFVYSMGNDDLTFGTGALPDDFCPKLTIRHVRLVTGRQVQEASEAKLVESGKINVRTITADTKIYPGSKLECPIPANAQVLINETDLKRQPPAPRVLVYLREDVCPERKGLDRFAEISSDAFR